MQEIATLPKVARNEGRGIRNVIARECNGESNLGNDGKRRVAGQPLDENSHRAGVAKQGQAYIFEAAIT